MERLTWNEVHARRTARHGLSGPTTADLALAARAMCGAHAQVMSAAELSLGLRVAGTTRADVRTALWRDRALVKTFGPRGTVHLLAADDLPVWTAALSAVPSPNRFPDGGSFLSVMRGRVIGDGTSARGTIVTNGTWPGGS